jgi:hypothetical protein
MDRLKKALLMSVLGLLVASSVIAQTKVYEKPGLPPTETINGLKLYDIVVGSDAHNGIEVTKDSPIPITIMVSGKEDEKWDKFNTEVAVYAMPCESLRLCDRYLIYQGTILYLHGHSEVTFLWNGKNKEGKFLPAGKYKIYSLAKVFDKKGNLIAKASRFWRQDYIFDKSRDIVVLTMKPAQVQKEAKIIQQLWDFEDVSIGQIPAGWKVEATNQKGPLATWQVIEDKTAPSGKKVLAMTSPNHHFGGTFNICWTNAISFLDGEIEVHFKAIKGKEDQGGGVIWRVQDKDNYYIARFNPLENNFRIYYVRDGARKILASMKIALPAGRWYTMKIVQRGDHFEGYLNGRKLLESTDSLFAKPGGVGLWTKADAVTYFDDFKISPIEIRENK